MVLSGLETLLETGEDLTTPAPLMVLARERADGDVGRKTSQQMADLP